MEDFLDNSEDLENRPSWALTVRCDPSLELDQVIASFIIERARQLQYNEIKSLLLVFSTSSEPLLKEVLKSLAEAPNS